MDSQSGVSATPQSSLIYLVAGFGGGFTSTILLHPIDLLKVRMQLSMTPQTYKQLASSVFKKYGINGLYRGATANVLGNSVAWGSYMFLFNGLQQKIQRKLGIPLTPASTSVNLGAAFIAGICTVYVSNPMWVIKVRMCQTDRTNLEYKTFSRSWKTVINNEGLGGLYKGCVPGVFSTVHGCLMMTFYQKMKWYLLQRKINLIETNNSNEIIKLSSSEILIASVVSKASACVLTYPLQTIRTRLQNTGHNYKGIIDVLKKTVKYIFYFMVSYRKLFARNESAFGLYKGLLASLIRLTPASCITFITYETLTNILQTVMFIE